METISEEDEIEGKKCISCYFRGGFRLHVYVWWKFVDLYFVNFCELFKTFLELTRKY